MSVKDGGPVFPHRGPERLARSSAAGISFYERDVFSGLSLRDYFAAHAPIFDSGTFAAYVSGEQRDVIFKRAAESAYLWADAMIAAREVEP